MQADLFECARHDPRLAPAGYFAVLKAEAKPKDGSNICRACDFPLLCNAIARHVQDVGQAYQMKAAA